jgi:UDP-4-amino-4,6-dideoxy-N-acetyl-beta-L-altrosamine transaminase
VKDLPYSTQWIEEEDVEEVVRVLRSPWLTQGPTLERFEGALAEYAGARHAIAVANGTAALHLTCLALDLGPGRRLVTSTLSFAASANCGLYCGADIAFTDVDPETGNMTAATLRATVDKGRADVVIPVHFGGRPCDVEALAGVAGGAPIVEDACHAIGAHWLTSAGPVRVGSCARSAAVVFSFHPVKPMTTAEGGAILTNDDTLARRLRVLRSHGISRDPKRQQEVGPWFYEQESLGFNYRLTDLQAALGLSQLRRLDRGIDRRAELARMYRRNLAGLDSLALPPEEESVRSAWHLFPVRVRHPRRTRRQVFDELRQQGILAQVHYIPIHLHPYYRDRFGFKRGDLPVAEGFYDTEISLPLFPTMADDDVARVSDALRRALS